MNRNVANELQKIINEFNKRQKAKKKSWKELRKMINEKNPSIKLTSS